MGSYGGFLLALRDAVVVLALAFLVLSLSGAVWMAALAVWPVLVALAQDGRTWLALAVAVLAIALIWLSRMRTEAPQPPVQWLELDTSGYCPRCGSERPGLICPMCGVSVLDGRED